MKIKQQFLISIVTFGIMLSIIAASVILTEQQIAQLNNQAKIARDIQTGASTVNYISDNYFLYQDNSSLVQMQSELSKLSNELSSLNYTNPQGQTLINSVKTDIQRINTVFAGVVSFLENAPRNDRVRDLPSFQTHWSRMITQTQTLAFDSQQLSQNLSDQIDNVRMSNIILIFALLSAFGAYFIINYLIAYRNTLRSIDKLQTGIVVLGSGNLDYSLNAEKKDEIGAISSSVNQMAANLKAVTASKTELEREITERKKVQEELSRSEERFRTTLDSMIEGCQIISFDWRYLYVNDAAAMQNRLKKENLLGKNMVEVYPGIEQTHLFEIMKECMDQRKTCAFENKFAFPNGEQAWFQVTIQPSAEGIFILSIDITESKKAEETLKESEHLYRTIFDNSADGFQLVKPLYNENSQAVDCLFLKVNSAYERQSGLRANDVVGKTAKQIAPNTEQYWFDLFAEVSKTGKSQHVENYNEPTKRWYDFYVFPYSEGTVGALFRDITERKDLEKQLKDSERLAGIGATAGMVGHDIRNPLQAITCDLYLVKNELEELADNEQKKNAMESLDGIQNNIDYINKIVADLQDYAKPLNPCAQETNMKSVFNEIVKKNGIPKNIKIAIEVEDKAEIIVADPDFLKRIVSNLTLNAVQAMPNGGKLTIRAFADKKTDDVLITVKDTGVGIPEDVKPKLFTPMMTTKSKGQGFGLAVVKRMTEGLGGTVTFESTEGKGTTFIVRLPPQELNGKYTYKNSKTI